MRPNLCSLSLLGVIFLLATTLSFQSCESKATHAIDINEESGALGLLSKLKPLTIRFDLKCSECEKIFSVLQSFIVMNSTEEFIEAVVYDFCVSLNRFSNLVVCLSSLLCFIFLLL